ncbi:DUF443 domain-containing protein [Staphylococcus ratti]|uniref:DUF443 domain-containing protein n=1 Tax=Staphylococcus ratti TaxID=2892440 RepID=A0ABY3PFN7_9STAP|nr:DUF443 family protein [Staphylococcus ratti]UEX91141.1 DUF443 domain-containing protein [Staphylococcus ratti]
MRCETRIIYKNPKYRIIKYQNEYLMVDLVSTWLAFFLPMINWLIPKKYAKISQEEFEKLTLVQPTKNKIFWPSMAGATMGSFTLRKYGHLLDIQLEKNLVITICAITFLGILIFCFYLNKRLTIDYFKARTKHKGKIMLFPNFKHICLLLFAYIFSVCFSFLFLSMLVGMKSQNIIVYICWSILTLFFFLANMSSIGNEKVYVISKIKEVEK